MKCIVCGCDENWPCVDDEGLACSWASHDPPVCSFCVNEAAEMHQAFDRGFTKVGSGESMIEVYGEHEGQRFIEARRAGAA